MDGKVRLSPNWFLERIMLLKVALIGRSRHWRMYLDTRLSRFSTTHVFERSATVRFQEIFRKNEVVIKTQLVFCMKRLGIDLFKHA